MLCRTLRLKHLKLFCPFFLQFVELENSLLPISYLRHAIELLSDQHVMSHLFKLRFNFQHFLLGTLNLRCCACLQSDLKMWDKAGTISCTSRFS